MQYFPASETIKFTYLLTYIRICPN